MQNPKSFSLSHPFLPFYSLCHSLGYYFLTFVTFFMCVFELRLIKINTWSLGKKIIAIIWRYIFAMLAHLTLNLSGKKTAIFDLILTNFDSIFYRFLFCFGKILKLGDELKNYSPDWWTRSWKYFMLTESQMSWQEECWEAKPSACDVKNFVEHVPCPFTVGWRYSSSPMDARLSSHSFRIFSLSFFPLASLTSSSWMQHWSSCTLSIRFLCLFFFCSHFSTIRSRLTLSTFKLHFHLFFVFFFFSSLWPDNVCVEKERKNDSLDSEEI